VSAKATTDRAAPDRPMTEPPRSAQPVPSVTTEITAVTLADVAIGSTTPPQVVSRSDRDLKGAVYRIAPDGLWDTIWESTEDSPYDLAFDGGGLLIGTGNTGKIFRIQGEPATVTLVTRASAQQITMFHRETDGRLVYATANPGKVFRISSARADRGTYESDVKDASTVATWGSIRWRASTPDGSDVQLFSRSGNTATPDDTWSAWSEAYRNQNGEQVTSPKARYLQWRVVMTAKTASPVLTSVTTAYLERNLRPKVDSITVHPPGVVFQKPFSTGELELAGYDEPLSDGRQTSASSQPQAATGAPQLGRRVYQKGLQTFVWKADDDNGDRLMFDVMYRREAETSWQALKRALTDPILVWDTSSVPDGTYTIKVVASDSPSNAPGSALGGEMESTTFDIDNTPPRVSVTSIRREGPRLLVTFLVEDAQSPVQRVEYSLDANRWRVVYPKDGIPDSRREEFEVAVDGEAVARNVIIRATDAMNNAATAVAEPPRPTNTR
jgi:hypothetical protein